MVFKNEWLRSALTQREREGERERERERESESELDQSFRGIWGNGGRRAHIRGRISLWRESRCYLHETWGFSPNGFNGRRYLGSVEQSTFPNMRFHNGIGILLLTTLSVLTSVLSASNCKLIYLFCQIQLKQCVVVLNHLNAYKHEGPEEIQSGCLYWIQKHACKQPIRKSQCCLFIKYQFINIHYVCYVLWLWVVYSIR